jgi:hypothetical protein
MTANASPSPAFSTPRLSVKFESVLRGHTPCLNGGIVYGQNQANTACPIWVFGMEDVADIQITNESLASNHDLTVTSAGGGRMAVPRLRSLSVLSVFRYACVYLGA